MGLGWILNCDYLLSLCDGEPFYCWDISPEPTTVESFFTSAEDAGWREREYFLQKYWLCAEHCKPEYIKDFTPKSFKREGYVCHFSTPEEGAIALKKLLVAVGDDGEIWHCGERHAFRICGGGYEPLSTETMLGVYSPDISIEQLKEDIETCGQTASGETKDESIKKCQSAFEAGARIAQHWDAEKTYDIEKMWEFEKSKLEQTN